MSDHNHVAFPRGSCKHPSHRPQSILTAPPQLERVVIEPEVEPVTVELPPSYAFDEYEPPKRSRRRRSFSDGTSEEYEGGSDMGATPNGPATPNVPADPGNPTPDGEGTGA